MLLAIGIAAAIEYPVIQLTVDVISQIIIPEKIDAGTRNVNYEFKWVDINVTSSGENSWMSWKFINSTGGIMQDATFRVKDSADNIIFANWELG